MLDYFENKIEDFYGKALFVEGPRLIPQFKEFVSTVEKESMRPIFASAYQFMLTFLTSYVNTNLKQTGDHYQITISYLSHIENRKNEVRYLFTDLNKVKNMSRLNSRMNKQSNPDYIEFNTKRAEEIFINLFNSEELAETLKMIQKCSKEELENNNWSESRVRHLLHGLLIVFGGGARASVGAKMTITEFNNAVEKDGHFNAHVGNHKTKQLGAADLVFNLPRLYQCCEKFRDSIRLEATDPDTETLFATQAGGLSRLDRAMEVVKEFVDLSPGERNHFNSAIWRKLWAHWNQKHNKDSAHIGFEVMALSETTRDTYYNVRDPVRGITFTSKILDKVLVNHEEQEREEVHQQVEEEAEMEVDDPEPVSRKKRKNISGVDKPRAKRQKTTFTTSDQFFIRDLFLVDGETPSTLSGERINEMRRENETFGRIVKDLETKKSKEKTKQPLKDRVNQAIRKYATAQVKAKIP